MKRFLPAALLFSACFSAFCDNSLLEYYPWFATDSSLSVVSDAPPAVISPNNDGIHDTLVVPMEIRESRFLVEWLFIVEDERGTVVRTIRNKESRDLAYTFTRFWKSIGSTRRSVDVPLTVTWNGVMDNGEVAPDGLYYYYVTASDDNGNRGITEKSPVVVDMSPPEIFIEPLSAQDKIFGEGEKMSLLIRQRGSVEDEWNGAIYDADGAVVRTFRWSGSAPGPAEWNGTDDSGFPVKDGVYSYRISCTDIAGNSASAGVENIVFTSDRPSVAIAVSGSRYFSPNGDGVSDTVSFDVEVSLPGAQTGNRLSSWKVAISDVSGSVVRSFGGAAEPPSVVVWDGAGGDGGILPDGAYSASVVARYINGYEAVQTAPSVILDTVPPVADAIRHAPVYNPNVAAEFGISHSLPEDVGSPVGAWTARIVSAKDGRVVRERVYDALPGAVSWDGLTDDFTLADDGTYRYELHAVDAAGNVGRTRGADFSVDTAATELVLSADKTVFNPLRVSVSLTPVVKAGRNIVAHELSIVDRASGAEVWKMRGASLPGSFTWNGTDAAGKLVPDGDYVAVLTTEAANGSVGNARSSVMTIDTVPPEASLAAQYTLFSPNGDGRKDAVPVRASSSVETLWKGAVIDSRDRVVRHFSVGGRLSDFSWDGTDDVGRVVPDGAYKIAFEAVDAAGNVGRAELPGITVDASDTRLFVTADKRAFSPNGDGFLERQEFFFNTAKKDGVGSWRFSVVSGNGSVVRSWGSADGTKAIPPSIVWDGMDESGAVMEGRFRGELSVVYEKGDEPQNTSSAFVSSVTPPDLRVDIPLEYFSPDNDGVNDELAIKLSAETHLVGAKSWSFTIKDPAGNDFWQAAGTGQVADELVWDGRSNRGKKGELVESASEYPYEFTVTDEVGLVSTVTGSISIDLLVMEDGDVLKMRVPSIIFRSDNADFGVSGERDAAGNVITNGLTEAQRMNNERVLRRVAETLNKFRAFTVTVEGHANNVSGTQTEETVDTAEYGRALVPLSEKRAEFVMNELVRYGVERGRLSFTGRGGTQPVAARADVGNWWKNRRVEFILNR